MTVTPDNENGQDYMRLILSKMLCSEIRAAKVYEITYKTETNSRALVEVIILLQTQQQEMYLIIIVPRVPLRLKLPPTKPKKDVFKDDMSTSVDGRQLRVGMYSHIR